MRKNLKMQAKQRLRKCYWMMLVLCLLLAVTGLDYTSSISSISTNTESSEESASNFMDKVYTEISKGNTENSEKLAKDYIEKQKGITNKIGIVAIGHSRGALAQIVNGVSSGEMFNNIFSAIFNITKSKNAARSIFILLSLIFMIIIKIFVFNIFYVSIKRFSLEYCTYDKVPLNRFLYLIDLKKMLNVALTMMLKDIFMALWMLTVVGYLIKTFSYQMVPYILAENPTITPKKAITLSRQMMQGHKFEAFKLQLSFIGWSVLEFCTFGLSGIFFSNPYRELTMAEYYRYIRGLAKENQIPDMELLNDIYLYEKAEEENLKEAYEEIQTALMEAEGPVLKHTGIRGFFENIFGVTLFHDQDEMEYQDKKSRQLALKNYKAVMDKDMYPYMLYEHRNNRYLLKLSSIEYDRHYSLLSLIFIFFSMSFVGWCWEVSLHLVSDGVFVNRGVNHGPWLPIYGFGGVLILIFLYIFREKPFVEFLSGIVLCGGIEYSTAWYLETTHGGTKWWDYTGYFLNIHGRVCAEGLLIFGLGGLAIVYLLAPFLDNHFRRIPKKIAIIAAVLLMTVYVGDTIYSAFYPNTGDGITDYTSWNNDIPDNHEEVEGYSFHGEVI